MITVDDPDLLELHDVPARLPPRRNGRPVAIVTVRRWADVGVRGRRLEVIRVGGRVLTSERALREFLRAGNEQPARAKVTA
ncbi:MAG TPA: DUF1580 domain-containing protein [Gemmataceae bacterium]|nr:DUF1580 domain-containing protein [Gemmataceae bacterium]